MDLHSPVIQVNYYRATPERISGGLSSRNYGRLARPKGYCGLDLGDETCGWFKYSVLTAP